MGRHCTTLPDLKGSAVHPIHGQRLGPFHILAGEMHFAVAAAWRQKYVAGTFLGGRSLNGVAVAGEQSAAAVTYERQNSILKVLHKNLIFRWRNWGSPWVRAQEASKPHGGKIQSHQAVCAGKHRCPSSDSWALGGCPEGTGCFVSHCCFALCVICLSKKMPFV